MPSVDTLDEFVDQLDETGKSGVELLDLEPEQSFVVTYDGEFTPHEVPHTGAVCESCNTLLQPNEQGRRLWVPSKGRGLWKCMSSDC